jgi:hypothetical protein
MRRLVFDRRGQQQRLRGAGYADIATGIFPAALPLPCAQYCRQGMWPKILTPAATRAAAVCGSIGLDA